MSIPKLIRMTKQSTPNDKSTEIVRYELKDAENSFGVETWLDFIAAHCTACGWCIDVCPEGVFSFNLNNEEKESIKGRKLAINIEWCLPCGNCLDVCKPGAIVDHSFKYIREFLIT